MTMDWRPPPGHDVNTGLRWGKLKAGRRRQRARPPRRSGHVAGQGLTFDDAQEGVWWNKAAKGFNTTSVEREFCLLYAELGEAYDAWRKHQPRPPSRFRRLLAALHIRKLPRADAPQPVRDEVADAMIFLLGLAEMLGFKASDAVAEKMAVNQARRYQRLSGGTHAQVPGVAP